MLSKQAFVLTVSSVVGFRISPPVQEISTLTVRTSSVACSLLCGRAVVDNIDFIHVLARQCDLVQNRVVINAVAVHPVGFSSLGSCGIDEVNVEQFWMIGNHAIVVFAWVVVLHQMVPSMPAPNHVATRCSIRLDFDDFVGPDTVATARCIGCNRWVSARLQAFLFGFRLPSDHQNVAVWHRFDVMV